ncbi:hypothetical protein CIG75_17915 [Tumebacillus algifaecis]|uniref:VOC domain-containing protein n=1 Tax=Tumebacillus algifaecis TaxID=1214604 RepID=A0A223D597_9BACL|nr:VOC family protein [Tumebacillus algifaecis]ASS76660.1 hypothetical protein CIG75_17915 [Tumebacillus algifaecis]
MEKLFERVDTVILRVQDLQAARAWYEQKLGLTAGYYDEAEGYLVLNLSETPISLYQLRAGETRPSKGAAGSYPILFTKEIERVHAVLTERGVEVEPIQTGGGVSYFIFHDLDGNRLEACMF